MPLKTRRFYIHIWEKAEETPKNHQFGVEPVSSDGKIADCHPEILGSKHADILLNFTPGSTISDFISAKILCYAHLF